MSDDLPSFEYFLGEARPVDLEKLNARAAEAAGHSKTMHLKAIARHMGVSAATVMRYRDHAKATGMDWTETTVKSGPAPKPKEPKEPKVREAGSWKRGPYRVTKKEYSHDSFQSRLAQVRGNETFSHPGLTETERKVAEMAHNKYTDWEIGDEMQMTQNQISFHRTNIKNKGAECPRNPELSTEEKIYHLHVNKGVTDLAMVSARTGATPGTVKNLTNKLRVNGLLPPARKDYGTYQAPPAKTTYQGGDRFTMEDTLPGFGDFIAEAKYDRNAIWDKYKDRIMRRAHEARAFGGGTFKQFEPGEPTSLQTNPEVDSNGLKHLHSWTDTSIPITALRMSSHPDGEAAFKQVIGTDKSIQDYAKDNFMDAVEAAAPRQKAVEKIVKLYATGGIQRFEDIGTTVAHTFAQYHSLLKNGHLQGHETAGYDASEAADRPAKDGEEKTLFQSIHPYRQLVQKYADKVPVTDRVAGLKEGKDYTIVHDDENVTAYHIHTEKAAHALGHDPHTGNESNWCTMRGAFADHNKQGPLIAIHPKKPRHKGELYQYHMASRQCNDEHDHDIVEKHRDLYAGVDDEDDYDIDLPSHEEELNYRFSFRNPNTSGLRHTMKGEERGLGDKLKNYSLDYTLNNNPQVALSAITAGSGGSSHFHQLADRWRSTHDDPETTGRSHDLDRAYEFHFTHGSSGAYDTGGAEWLKNQESIGPLLKDRVLRGSQTEAKVALLKHPAANIDRDDLVKLSNHELGSHSREGYSHQMAPRALDRAQDVLDAMESHPAFQALRPDDDIRRTHSAAYGNVMMAKKMKFPGFKTESTLPTFGDFLAENRVDIDKVVDDLWDKHKDVLVKRAHEANFGSHKRQIEPGEQSGILYPKAPSYTGEPGKTMEGHWNDMHTLPRSLRMAHGSDFMGTLSVPGTPSNDHDIATAARHRRDAKIAFKYELMQATPKTKGQPNPKAMKKIASMYASGAVKKAEDISGQLGPLFKKVELLRSNGLLKGKESDVYDVSAPHFQSMDHYEALVRDHKDDFPKIPHPVDDLKEGEDYRTLFRGKEATICQPLTAKGAHGLSFSQHDADGEPRETRWCTRGEEHFKSHNSEGPLFVTIPHTPHHDGEMYQTHFESGQAMDEKDYDIGDDSPGVYGLSIRGNTSPQEMHRRIMNNRFKEDQIGDVLQRLHTEHNIIHRTDEVTRNSANWDRQKSARDLWRTDPDIRSKVTPGRAQQLDYAFGENKNNETDEQWIANRDLHPETINHIIKNGNMTELAALARHPDVTDSHAEAIYKTGKDRGKNSETAWVNLNDKGIEEHHKLFQSLLSHPRFSETGVEDNLGRPLRIMASDVAQERANRVADPVRGYKPFGEHITEEAVAVNTASGVTAGGPRIAGLGADGEQNTIVRKKKKDVSIVTEILRRTLSGS